MNLNKKFVLSTIILFIICIIVLVWGTLNYMKQQNKKQEQPLRGREADEVMEKKIHEIQTNKFRSK